MSALFIGLRWDLNPFLKSKKCPSPALCCYEKLFSRLNGCVKSVSVFVIGYVLTNWFSVLLVRLCSLSPTVTASARGFTVERSRNQGELEPLSFPASPAAPLSPFPCAVDVEAASRPVNIAAAHV